MFKEDLQMPIALTKDGQFPDEGQVIKSYASSVFLCFWMVINGCSAQIHSFTNSCSKHTGAL